MIENSSRRVGLHEAEDFYLPEKVTSTGRLQLFENIYNPDL